VKNLNSGTPGEKLWGTGKRCQEKKKEKKNKEVSQAGWTYKAQSTGAGGIKNVANGKHGKKQGGGGLT